MKYFSSLLLIFTISINASILECEDIHTTLTTSTKSQKYSTESHIEKKNKIIKILLEEDNTYVIGTEKVKLTYLNNGVNILYFYEKTPAGNINLYALNRDGTLTISKSYDAFGNKMNAQLIFECSETR